MLYGQSDSFHGVCTDEKKMAASIVFIPPFTRLPARYWYHNRQFWRMNPDNSLSALTQHRHPSPATYATCLFVTICLRLPLGSTSRASCLLPHRRLPRPASSSPPSLVLAYHLRKKPCEDQGRSATGKTAHQASTTFESRTHTR